MKTSNNKYKILVLSDLKKNSSNTLKSTVSLAKMVDGEINFFHVKTPSEIVEKENQLSAMRTINSEYSATEKKIRNLIKPFSEDYGANIQSSFSFGNIKDEIANYIQEYQPDIIVLGKRKINLFRFMGDQITQFVLNSFKGTIMIAANNSVLEPNQSISLGMFNETETAFNIDFAEDLIGNAQQPLKSFKIINSADELEEKKVSRDQKIVEYVFEQSDNAIKNVSTYLSKNNINLLCINRRNNDAIHKLNVSLLVSN